MNLNELTLGEIKEIAALIKGSSCSTPSNLWRKYLTPGKSVFIRSVTHHYVGCVEECDDTVLVLSQASWIADDGRFHEALKTGILKEIEPYPNNEPVLIGLGAILDVCKWQHNLPTEAK